MMREYGNNLIDNNRRYLNKMNNINDNSIHDILSLYQEIIDRILDINIRLNNRVRQLQKELLQMKPENILLKEDKDQQLIYNFVEQIQRLTNDLQYKYRRYISQPRKRRRYKKDENDNIRNEMNRIHYFIDNQLVYTVVIDDIHLFPLPKDLILSLYIKWSEKRGQKILIDNNNMIKQLITNKLKYIYPSLVDDDRYYIGITFRSDLLQQIKSTQVKTKQIQIRYKQQQIDINEQQLQLFDIQNDDNFTIQTLIN